MRIALMAALAASTLAAAPAIAQNGKAYGHDPKVCLVTWGSEADRMSQADATVVKAQYLPLRIAMRKEAESDNVSDIYTYGTDGYTGDGVDYHYAGDSTEATCAMLAEIAESNDDSDD
jgi:hypothetical protein